MAKGKLLVMSDALRRGLAGLLGGSKVDRSAAFDVSRATVKDVDDLVTLAEAFRAEHSSEWGEGSLAQWARWQVKGSVQHPDHVVLIARADGTAVGYTCGMVDRSGPQSIGKIEAVYVLPGMRGTGLAERLFGTALDALTQKGAAGMELVVSADNARAQAFFAKFGFGDGDRVMAMSLDAEDGTRGPEGPAVQD